MTAGVGEASTPLAAFDRALLDAGIGNYNLIALSSVIPAGARIVRVPGVEADATSWGDRLYVVLAEYRQVLTGGLACAGLGWLQEPTTGQGLFVEHYGDNQGEVDCQIVNSLTSMRASRHRVRRRRTLRHQHRLSRSAGLRGRGRRLRRGNLADAERNIKMTHGSVSLALAAVGSVLAVVAGSFYVVDVLRGGSRPHPVSSGVWFLIGLLGVGGAIEAGAGAGAAVAVVYLGVGATIFVLSCLPHYTKPERRRYDIPLGVVVAMTLVLWRLMHFAPSLAVTVAVVADASVTLLVLRAARQQPSTESTFAWVLTFISAILGAAAVARTTYAALVYPLYLVAGNGAIAALLLTAEWRRYRSSTPSVRRV